MKFRFVTVLGHYNINIDQNIFLLEYNLLPWTVEKLIGSISLLCNAK